MGEKRRCCPCCSAVVCVACLVCVGIIITCLGAASIPLLEDIYRKELKKQMILKNGSESYNNWRKSPAPIYMQFYVFNYTNVDDFMSGKSKPSVKEKGPYSYREFRVNEVIQQDDQTITYLPNNTYVFDPDTSCEDCREEDTLTVVNVAVLTVMEMIKKLNIKNPGWLLRDLLEIVNAFINADKDFRVFTQLTVRHLLWGYYNPVLHRLKLLEELLKHFGIDLPPIDDFVALEYNGTRGALHEGNLTISTGIDDVDDTQKILKWRGLPNAPYWQTKYGEMLNGTDGTRFKPFISRDDRIFIFNSDICRSIYLEYDSDDSIMDVPLYRYSTTSYLFANFSVNPDNAAFCGPNHCYGSGILPLGQCQTGNPPVFMSAPHFYQGDPSLLDAINGLNPIKAKHATFVSVEPRTGLAFSGYKRIQINVMAQPDEYFNITHPFTRNFTFLPLLWVQETAVIDKASVEKFKEEVVKPQLILKWLSNGLMILGAVIVVCALPVGFWKKRKISKKYTLLETDVANNGNPKTA